MKKEIQNQTCENNAEVERNLEQATVSAQDSADEEQEWWLSVKYPDSASESER